MSFPVASRSPEDTAAIAATLAPLLRAGDVVTLSGDLAAGKTTFVQGLVGALGGAERPTSPTFGIAQFYDTPLCAVLHVDAYRLTGAAAFRDLGLDRYADDALMLIEWGEIVESEFPDRLSVAFAFGDGDARMLSFTAHGARWRERAGAIEQKLGAR